MPTLTPLAPEATLAEVRKAQGDAARALIELRSVPAEKRTDDHKAAMAEVVNTIHDNDLIEKALDAAERGARAEAEERALAKQVRGGASLRPDLGLPETRSMAAQLVEDDRYAAWAAERRGGVLQVEVRNLLGEFGAGAYATGTDAWLPVGTPTMATGAMQRRRAFFRDLVSVQSTGLKVVPYLREKNALTNETGAQMTSEGSAKAEVTMEFERYNAIVEKITAWLPATDEILTDAPTLRGYIETRLEYMLMIREEQQCIAGTGTSPQLPGVESLSGSYQTQSIVASDYPATIGLAMGKVENVDGEADGVLTNPLDYWVAVTTRHADALDNGFGGGAPATMSGITWGVPAVRTRAVTSGSAYVAAWKLACTLFDRQDVTIKIGDQHVDYFIRNLVALLAEKRIGLAWHRPALIVKATVPTS